MNANCHPASNGHGGCDPRTLEDEIDVSRPNLVTRLVAAVATAVITAIYSSLISKWSGLNLACLLAFGAILLTYMFLFVRGVEMEMPA